MATIAQELEQIGYEKGIEEGRYAEKIALAQRLLELHDVVTVSELTGLTIEVVEKIQKTQ